jgi:hypothetical protein
MTRGRGLLSVLLIISLLATGAMRTLVQARHDAIVPRPRSLSRLSGMNSFTLGLLLGGLRGPLVMLLWSSSENQKMSKNLEDIDTKIELIRMLQPEFDSVHIFQIWNKAYNISIMMANLQNKYSTILDALDYARKVDAERPDNINILASMGELYMNKLGNPVAPWTEKRFYNGRVCTETLPKPAAQKQQKDQPGFRRTQHQTMLTADGFILPELLEPRTASSTLVAQGYTGADLQFLARYNTPAMGGFPYGLHPLAIAYNYYKRAATLQTLTGRKHVYLSEAVVDSRGGIALQMWAENEWDHARRLEAQSLGKPLSDEKIPRELATASVKLGDHFLDSSEKTRSLLQEALFSYRRAAVVARDAEADFRRHVANRDFNMSGNAEVYRSHIDECLALASLLAADRDYLAIMAASADFPSPLVPKDQIDQLRRSAAAAYQKAIDQYYLLILKYYTEDEVAHAVYRQGTQQYTKDAIPTLDPKLYPEFHAAAKAYAAQHLQRREFGEDIAEYETYIRRASERLTALKQ